jgi:hypothetical protein
LGGHEDPTLDAKHLYPCENPLQGKPNHMPSDASSPPDKVNETMGREFQTDAVATMDKPTVYIGHGFATSPGNVAFRQFAVSKKATIGYRMQCNVN